LREAGAVPRSAAAGDERTAVAAIMMHAALIKGAMALLAAGMCSIARLSQDCSAAVQFHAL
jgi:hypothetical protein